MKDKTSFQSPPGRLSSAVSIRSSPSPRRGSGALLPSDLRRIPARPIPMGRGRVRGSFAVLRLPTSAFTPLPPDLRSPFCYFSSTPDPQFMKFFRNRIPARPPRAKTANSPSQAAIRSEPSFLRPPPSVLGSTELADVRLHPPNLPRSGRLNVPSSTPTTSDKDDQRMRDTLTSCQQSAIRLFESLPHPNSETARIAEYYIRQDKLCLPLNSRLVGQHRYNDNFTDVRTGPCDRGSIT